MEQGPDTMENSVTKRLNVKRSVIGAAAVLTLGAAGFGAPAASAAGDASPYDLKAQLHSLNDSGVTGAAQAHVHGTQVDVFTKVDQGAAPKLPHAQHIHYGEQAKHECPTFKDDANHDFRLNVAEGVPQYGAIAVSLTRTGDTSPASGLALDRMPVAGKQGYFRYTRNNLDIAASETESAREIAAAIARGEGVVVVHGVDYNGNGTYDLDGAGPSELDPSGATPAEATDPAACGTLDKK